MASDSENNWYLREWAARDGKRQADLGRDLGWQKNTANRIWHGRQPYRRDIVNQVAAWLGIEPYELLMPPEQAIALRNLRQTARMIAAEEAGAPFEPAPPATRGGPRR
jgi:transcriptional regulator with XRE-family HTH domain